jgi:predicted kinase
MMQGTDWAAIRRAHNEQVLQTLFDTVLPEFPQAKYLEALVDNLGTSDDSHPTSAVPDNSLAPPPAPDAHTIQPAVTVGTTPTFVDDTVTLSDEGDESGTEQVVFQGQGINPALRPFQGVARKVRALAQQLRDVATAATQTTPLAPKERLLTPATVERHNVLFVVAGPTCSGKTTFAEKLAKQVGATVIHQDAYFKHKSQLTPVPPEFTATDDYRGDYETPAAVDWVRVTQAISAAFYSGSGVVVLEGHVVHLSPFWQDADRRFLCVVDQKTAAKRHRQRRTNLVSVNRFSNWVWPRAVDCICKMPRAPAVVVNTTTPLDWSDALQQTPTDPVPEAMLVVTAKTKAEAIDSIQAGPKPVNYINFADFRAECTPKECTQRAIAMARGEMADAIVIYAAKFAVHAPVNVCAIDAMHVPTVLTHDDVPEAPTLFLVNDHAYILDDCGADTTNPPPRDPITEMFQRHGLVQPHERLLSMPGDGNCVFHAIHRLYPHTPVPQRIRALTAQTLQAWGIRAGGDNHHLAVAAYQELRKYWTADQRNTDACLRSQWDNIFINGYEPHPNWVKTYYLLDETTVLRKTDKGYVCFSKEYSTSGDYDKAYDGRLDPFARERGIRRGFVEGSPGDEVWQINSDAPYLLVNRHTRLFQSPRLLAATEHITQVFSPVIYAHEGVPGAGKTTSIIMSAQPGDIILTGCRETANETREELKRKRPDEEIEVRTADSYILNSRKPFKTVYFDERYAVHAGYLPLIGALTGCEAMHTYGDPKQIPCFSRVLGVPFLNNRVTDTQRVVELVSKRIPLDVARLIAPYYSDWGRVATKNPIRDSLSFQKVSSVADIPAHPDATLMTWTQEEKKELSKIPRFRNIITIGEAQGITKNHTVLIRTKPKSLALYTKKEQFIVAVTRHKVSFKYYSITDSNNDIIWRNLTKAPEGRLDLYADPHPFDMAWLKGVRAGRIERPRLSKPNVCYRPGAPDLKLAYQMDNGHLPHSAPKAYNLSYEPVARGERLRPSAPVYGATYPGPGLQADYDSYFRTPTAYNERFHSMLVERGDFESIIPDSRIKFHRDRPVKVHGNEQLNMFSSLRTLQPWPRPSTQRQLLKAIEKRNCNTSRYTGACDPEEMATEVVEYAFDALCKPDWRERSAGFNRDPIKIDPQAIDDYLITAEPAKYRNLGTAHLAAGAPDTLRVDPDDFRNYAMMFRREPKNRLSNESVGEYQILQTVIHHAPKVNIVCSFFRVLYDRFKSILKPTVFVQLKKSLADLEEHLNEHVPPGTPGFENDFEKFDKSQLIEALSLEFRAYQILGIDKTLEQLWSYGMTLTEAKNLLLGVRIFLLYQRKTGSVTTSFGNVLVNMISTCWAYKLGDSGFVALYYVGDDSFIFIATLPDALLATENLALYFNLLGKVIQGMGNYFCSCFMVWNGHSWLVYPDPFKRIERLSYPINMQEQETLYDRWLSFCDSCKNYNDASGVRALAEQCALRYVGCRIASAVASIVGLCHSFQAFKDMYEPAPREKEMWLGSVPTSGTE